MILIMSSAPGRGALLEDMELLPETKGLLAMIYRNYWCTEEERKEYDRILMENDRKCGRRSAVEENPTDEESGPRLQDLCELFPE